MTSSDLRCPQCSAHIRPDAGWCTLCYADLRVPPEPPEPRESPATEVVTEGDPAAELTAGLEPDADHDDDGHDDDGRGKHARSATTYDDAVAREAATPRDEAASAELAARADQMLAILAAENSRPLGPWADHLESSTSRVVVGLIGLVVLALGGLLVMTVLGQFV